MKRHDSLVEISRFHRSVLFLAQMAKRNGPAFKGYPTDVEGKAAYALSFFDKSLREHFLMEDHRLLPNVRGKTPELDRLAREIQEEHIHLIHLFEALRTPTALEGKLDDLGVALEKHVRKEERELFQKIQEAFSESELQELKKRLF